MRYLLSLCLLLLVISPALAQNPLSENQGKATKTLNQLSWSRAAWGIISPSASVDDGRDRLFSPTKDGTHATCLKMRSYYVERESKQSDVTNLTGYSTCTPSEKFDLKSAEDDPRK
jgi:hypothetical protein